MNHTLLMLFVLFALALSSQALAHTEFTDGEFDFANDWSSYGPFNIPSDAQNSDFGVQQQMQGGNPGAYGETDLTRATVASGEVATWAAIINDTLVWDPQASGAVDHADFQVDWRRPSGTGARTATLAVEQGGFVWLALNQRLFLDDDGWFTIQIGSLVEANFIALPGSDAVIENQPLHPDFSANGAPIAFGIGIGRSCPATSNCTTIVPSVLDFDNLRVRVCKTFEINAGLNGNWWNGLARNGEGVQVEVSDGGDGSLILVATVYSYDSLGNQIFLIAVGTVTGNTAEVDVFVTTGGQWGDNYSPDLVIESQWGTGVFTACGCGDMHMSLTPNAEFQGMGYTSLAYDLFRLTTPLLACPLDNPI